MPQYHPPTFELPPGIVPGDIPLQIFASGPVWSFC